METQFEKLGAAIRSFRVNAISAKHARETTSDEDSLLLSKIREVETATNIAKSEDLVLKTLCALGLEIATTINPDDSTSSVYNLEQCNNVVEMQTLHKLTTKTASQALAFKQIAGTRSIFEEKSRNLKSDMHFDEILKLNRLLGGQVQHLQELTETQQQLNALQIQINRKLTKETHIFSEELNAQRIELENKRNIDKDGKLQLKQKIHTKLEKINTTRMLMNILMTISDIDLEKNPPYKKLLRACRTSTTIESL